MSSEDKRTYESADSTPQQVALLVRENHIHVTKCERLCNLCNLAAIDRASSNAHTVTKLAIGGSASPVKLDQHKKGPDQTVKEKKT